MSTPSERQTRVADIIRDLWPHRMSLKAAEIIDAYYVREFVATPVAEAVAAERVRIARAIRETPQPTYMLSQIMTVSAHEHAETLRERILIALDALS